MSSLLRHISRNLPPYQYKEALEEMYANLEEFDAICNSNFLPAFEQENDSNQSTNSEESTEKKSTDVTATSSSKTEVDLTNKNAANPKQKKDPIFKKDASFGEKLKAIAKALAEMIHKMVGWFADKIGKIDFADQEFLKRLDNAKGKGIQNVDITTYNYGIDIMRKCVTIMDQDFEKFDNTVNTIFEKYDEACNDGKTDPKDVSDTIKVDGLEMMNEECDFKPDYFKTLYTNPSKFGLTEPTGDDALDDTADKFVKAWEATARGKKVTCNLNSQEGKNLIESAEKYLRQGFENLIKTLKHGTSNLESSQKGVNNLITAAMKNDITNKNANERMTKYLNTYNRYISFASMFYKTAYNLAVEARTNCKLLLQRAYNF